MPGPLNRLQPAARRGIAGRILPVRQPIEMQCHRDPDHEVERGADQEKRLAQIRAVLGDGRRDPADAARAHG